MFTYVYIVLIPHVTDNALHDVYGSELLTKVVTPYLFVC